MKKNLKQANIKTVEFEALTKAQVEAGKKAKKYPVSFDFNAMCELQETYEDPFEAFEGLDNMNLKAIGALIHASLKAGAEAQEKSFNLSRTDVGNTLMKIMMIDQAAFQTVLEAVTEAIAEFLPQEPEEVEAVEAEIEGNPKN